MKKNIVTLIEALMFLVGIYFVVSLISFSVLVYYFNEDCHNITTQCVERAKAEEFTLRLQIQSLNNRLNVYEPNSIGRKVMVNKINELESTLDKLHTKLRLKN